jgi:gamma-glutamyltranspeptidase/glutathione hydrolase
MTRHLVRTATELVTGSPGGPTIISVTLKVLNWMRLGMDAQAAINAPRFHHQWLPDVIRWKGFPGFEDALNRGPNAAPRPHRLGERH